MRKLRVNFIRDQLDLVKHNPKGATAEAIVGNFRRHYPNTSSFASSISRFKSELKKLSLVSSEFLSQLKPSQEEIASVHDKNRRRLQEKCQNSITLKNSGDNIAHYVFPFLPRELRIRPVGHGNPSLHWVSDGRGCVSRNFRST